MNTFPTVDQLKILFAKADDSAGNHSLWIDKAGEVHLSLIPQELSPVGFEAETPSMQVRFGTLNAGGSNLGPGAAADDKYMANTFGILVASWTPPFKVGKVKFVDG
jgi:hypothetical protein